MQLMIDIPEDTYQHVINTGTYGHYRFNSARAIRNGIPLPENHGRKFEGIVVEYPPAELCIYPEYKGKPYYNIKYRENDKECVGFGTYNSEVLSEFIKEYFMSDIQPKTGRWINAKVGRLFPSNDFKCSECGNILDFNGVNCGRGDANFCPNCGAKMVDPQEESDIE